MFVQIITNYHTKIRRLADEDIMCTRKFLNIGDKNKVVIICIFNAFNFNTLSTVSEKTKSVPGRPIH